MPQQSNELAQQVDRADQKISSGEAAMQNAMGEVNDSRSSNGNKQSNALDAGAAADAADKHLPGLKLDFSPNGAAQTMDGATQAADGAAQAATAAADKNSAGKESSSKENSDKSAGKAAESQNAAPGGGGNSSNSQRLSI